MSKTVIIRAPSKIAAVLLVLVSTAVEGWEVSLTSAERLSASDWRVTVTYRDPEDEQ